MGCRKSRLLAAAVFGLAMLGLSACNTVAGAGKDVSAVGHDMTGSSTKTQDKVTDSTGAAKN
nr:entericidin [uncultured Lichenicoccus sp.]